MSYKKYIPFDDSLKEDMIVQGKVKSIQPYGAFIELKNGVVGLLHIEDMSIARIKSPYDRFSIGQEVNVKIKSIDKENHRIMFTYKELLGTWEENAKLFKEGTKVKGIIRNTEAHKNGIFIELKPNLVGMAEYQDGMEYGKQVDVFIKKIIPEKKKIKLIICSQIKAEVSPFAIREGEIKVFDGKDGYVSMNQIINKINIGHITDIHFKILEIVNEFEFITSRQIYQLLKIKGVDIKSQDKLNKKLEQLVKTKILTRYYFHSEDGKGIYRIYCLEKMGKYLLNSRDIECKWQPTDNVKPVALIKKRLAGNQTILAYLRKVKAFDSYVVKPQLTAKTLGKVFKASGGSVKLTKNNKSISFLFEVVRREEDWQNKLVDKMRLYKDFYENFVPGDSGFQIMPQLIFVCEDEKHAAETFKTIVTKRVEISKIKLYFTTDLRQNKDSLEETLIEFRLDENTNKYKVANVDLKLLEE